jgi:hypothetical protein
MLVVVAHVAFNAATPSLGKNLFFIGFIAIFKLTYCFSYPKIKVSLSLEEKMLRLFHCSMTFSTQI